MFAGEFGALYPNLQTCSALSDYLHVPSASDYSYPFSTRYRNRIAKPRLRSGLLQPDRNSHRTAKSDNHRNPHRNGKLNVTVTLVNTGYGRVIRPRPESLIFVSNGSTVAQFPIALAAMDLSQLASSATPVPQTFQFNVTLPATFPPSGLVSAALLIPDPASSLSPEPAYALPLNSVDQNNNPIFDPTTGYNLIASFNAE